MVKRSTSSQIWQDARVSLRSKPFDNFPEMRLHPIWKCCKFFRHIGTPKLRMPALARAIFGFIPHYHGIDWTSCSPKIIIGLSVRLRFDPFFNMISFKLQCIYITSSHVSSHFCSMVNYRVRNLIMNWFECLLSPREVLLSNRPLINLAVYSRLPHNSYPSVDSPRYGLWGSMCYEGGTKILP